MLLGGPMTAVNETRGLSVNGIILMGNAVTFQSGGSVFFESNVETMEPYVIWRLRTRFGLGQPAGHHSYRRIVQRRRAQPDLRRAECTRLGANAAACCWETG